MVKKFDVVIGNPPYQEEAVGDATHAMPIYHQFMEAAYGLGLKVVLITPARFLFNAGYTPKAWNERMLSDPHLTVPHYEPNSDTIFPGTDIKGGIAVTYRDSERVFGPIETFTKFTELNDIVHKVHVEHGGSLASLITSSRSYAYTDAMHQAHPTAAATMAKGEQYKINTKTFELLPFLYAEDRPSDGADYIQVLGLIKNKRFFRWIRSDYVTGPESFRTHKVILPAANGSGRLGEVLSSPLVGDPEVAVTQSFITIGSFPERSEAEACLKYVKTKFARALLGVLKITQHNPAKVWKHVPLQDFTAGSDIDWTKSVAEIDQQLYAKYALTPEDITFIESHVKPME